MDAKDVIEIKEVDGKIYHLLHGKESEREGCKKCVADGSSNKKMKLCADLGVTCTSRQQTYWKEAGVKRYFIGKMFERNGDYEYNIAVLFELEGRKKPEKHMDWMAQNQYSGSKRKDGDGWYFNLDEVYVEPAGFKEISKATYDELSRFI